ncbi:hypothetical protein [Pontivivens ytuae]|uniref:Uncharacterized protein n=1 Tax=Pontivivens ytuae TaxID=2789856 RepID=A0A7S9LPW7_9RHOB|nr:hypothetical protein [Pontivivens ytuae]QPH53037.1 hypothetical protein I0K15_14680 [Pontivivens ytuae]
MTISKEAGDDQPDLFREGVERCDRCRRIPVNDTALFISQCFGEPFDSVAIRLAQVNGLAPEFE